MAEIHPVAAPAPPLRLTQWIERSRYFWFALIAVSLLVSFNGQWHIGPDSAAYRALGHQLATTGKYFFRERVVGVDDYANQQETRYPGLPMFLAGLEKVFGPGDFIPILAMQLMVVILLVVTYRVMLYRVAPWLAVSVLFGMGMNVRFLENSNEILSDLPFLLSIMVLLLGYERLLRARDKRQVIWATLLLLGGALVAAVMRPTFYFVGAALAVASIYGLITGRSQFWKTAPQRRDSVDSRFTQIDPVPRWKFALPVSMLLIAFLLFVLALDVRKKSCGVLAGGYEAHILTRLDKLWRLAPDSTHQMLEKALPVAFYGNPIGSGLVHLPGFPGELKFGFSTVYSLLVIGSAIWLVRRNVLWGLIVLATIVGFSLMGAVPRYFIMLLPLLLASWGNMVLGLARLGMRPGSTKPAWFRELVLFTGLASVVGFNLVNSVDFILKQRGYSRPFTDSGRWVGFHHRGFLAVYHNGLWQHVYELADMIKANTAKNEKLLGPEATVMTYLTGRQVYFAEAAQRQQEQAHRGDGSLFHLALIPVNDQERRFHEYDDKIRELAQKRQISTGRVLAGPVGGYELVEFAVVAPHPHRVRTSTTTAASRPSP